MANAEMKTVTIWLAKLALMTGNASISKTRIGINAMALADELPNDAFTEASLKEVAEGCDSFPTYKVLLTSLRTWLDLHPAVPLITNVSLEFQAYLDEQDNTEAHRNRQLDRDARCRADWSDPQKIRESIAKLDGRPMRHLLGKILGNAVRANAPENLGYLPPEWQGEVT